MGPCTIADGIAEPPLTIVPESFQCRCGHDRFALSYPFCSGPCRQQLVNKRRMAENNAGHYPFDVHCVVSGCRSIIPCWRGIVMVCSRCFLDEEQYPQVSKESQLRAPTQTRRCSQSFVNRQYASESIPYTALKEHVQAHFAEAGLAWPLVQHSELYVCAHEYKVRNLKENCLYKLHHNLVRFEIDDRSVEEIVELVIYVYENTADEGNILEGTADKLRDLVMAFVVDQAGHLTKYDSFSQVIGAGGAHTTDFFKLTYHQKE